MIGLLMHQRQRLSYVWINQCAQHTGLLSAGLALCGLLCDVRAQDLNEQYIRECAPGTSEVDSEARNFNVASSQGTL